MAKQQQQQHQHQQSNKAPIREILFLFADAQEAQSGAAAVQLLSFPPCRVVRTEDPVGHTAHTQVDNTHHPFLTNMLTCTLVRTCFHAHAKLPTGSIKRSIVSNDDDDDYYLAVAKQTTITRGEHGYTQQAPVSRRQGEHAEPMDPVSHSLEP